MARRLLGNFSPEHLVQVLNFIPRVAQSLIITRGGPRRSDLTQGPPGQINIVRTMSSMAKKVLAKDSKNHEDNREETKENTKGQR